MYPNDNVKINWDIWISLVLLITCFQTPLNFAFQEELDSYTWLIVVTYVIDLLFLIDIVINFNSAIQLDGIEMIDDRKTISKNYLTGWFLIDFLSILPFELILLWMATEEELAN